MDDQNSALNHADAPGRKHLFSAQDNAFYFSDEIDIYRSAGTLPADLVEVPEAVFQTYALALAPVGQQRGVSADGQPCWVDIPPPPPEVVAARNEAKRAGLMELAAERIAPLQDAADLEIATPQELAALRAWKAYRVQLNRLSGAAGYPKAVVWPEQPV